MIDSASLVITLEMLTLIAQVDEFKGAWQLFSQLPPEWLQAMETDAIIKSIGSVMRLTGAHFSDAEIELIISYPQTYNAKSVEEQEVISFATAYTEVTNNFDSIPFTENSIKQLHGWIMKAPTIKPLHTLSGATSAYKSIDTVDTHGPDTSYNDMSLKIQELIYWTRENLENATFHPLIIIGAFTIFFSSHHPFERGNKRLMHCIMRLLMLQAGYGYLRYVSLEAVFELWQLSWKEHMTTIEKNVYQLPINIDKLLACFLRSIHMQKQLLQDKIVQEKFFAHTFTNPFNYFMPKKSKTDKWQAPEGVSIAQSAAHSVKET